MFFHEISSRKLVQQTPNQPLTKNPLKPPDPKNSLPANFTQTLPLAHCFIGTLFGHCVLEIGHSRQHFHCHIASFSAKFARLSTLSPPDSILSFPPRPPPPCSHFRLDKRKKRVSAPNPLNRRYFKVESCSPIRVRSLKDRARAGVFVQPNVDTKRIGAPKSMSAILFLIPLSVVIAACFLAAFIWAVRSGQFETPAPRDAAAHA
jgi:cbb3-type cytochrome oxidase maturation protein